jgi:hypothetical protein
MSENTYPNILNIKPTNLIQENQVEFTTQYELKLTGKTYYLEITVKYFITNETISITIRDKYLNISYCKTIELEDIFRYNIFLQDNKPLTCNKDIYVYKRSLYFLYLMIKNSLETSDIDIKLELFAFKHEDFVFPKLDDQELVQILINKCYIERTNQLLSTDFVLLYLTYKKYKFMFCLNKYFI